MTKQPTTGQHCFPRKGRGRIPKERSLHFTRNRGELIIQLSGRSIITTQRNNKGKTDVNVAAWNVRTLQDNPNNLERGTAVIAKELSRYDIDIAALQKTHSSKNTDLATHFLEWPASS